MAGRVSQLAIGIIYTPNGDDIAIERSSQLAVGIIYTPSGDDIAIERVSQLAVDVIFAQNAEIVSQLAIGVLYTPSEESASMARVSQLAVGVLYTDTTARTTGITITIPERQRQLRQFKFTLSVYDKNDTWLLNLDMVDDWSQTIAANGGYVSADVSFKIKKENINDWIENGIGRRVKMFSPDSTIIWEGYIDSLNINIGALTYTLGSMKDIGNRVWVTYSPVDTSIEPPVTGDATESIIAENKSSQLKYGIWEKVLDGGQCTDEDAERYRDTWIYYNATPLASKDISLGATNEISISLGLVGFISWLDAYIFESSSILLTTATEKIKQVLAADINGVMSVDYSLIDTNNYLTPAAETNKNTFAFSSIKSIVDLGDIDNNRWIFGILDNRRTYYRAVKNEIKYYQRLSDPAQTIYDSEFNIVYPWNVMPGNWLFLLDFLPGADKATVLSEDSRAIFIEEVTFTFPWGLGFRGGTVKRIDQMLAKQAMSRGM